MHGLEWVFSIVLSVVFLLLGAIRVFRYERFQDKFLWIKDLPHALVQAIGVAEILGALGLILPAATGIYPWLTPVAAVALGLLMLVAAVFHTWRGEKDEAVLNMFLLVLLAFVAYVRWPLMP